VQPVPSKNYLGLCLGYFTQAVTIRLYFHGCYRSTDIYEGCKAKCMSEFSIEYAFSVTQSNRTEVKLIFLRELEHKGSYRKRIR